VELAAEPMDLYSSEQAATTRVSRRIDAAVMAHDRAAAPAGAVCDSIYIWMRYDPGVSPPRGRSQGHAFCWEAQPIGSMASPWGR
jgi:hypothetical protein